VGCRDNDARLFARVKEIIITTDKTNHRCIWHRLAAIYDASFDWGL